MPTIALKDILKISDLYKTAVLALGADVKPKYPVKASLLERVSLFRGDITELQIDSIVNAANKSLEGGGGVDGAIHRAAGPGLYEECCTLPKIAGTTHAMIRCQTGDAKITKAYRLPSRHVIHTVGPIYFSPDVETKAKQLASCYKTSLQLAVANSLKHIAFPSISTGIYSYPVEDATNIALDEVRRFLDSEEGETLDRVIFVVWSMRDKGVYEKLIPEYFPPTEDLVRESAAKSKETPVEAPEAPEAS
jgi:O-acetyl-ADP-ribose deacetylase (regulator of RNase III)